MPAGFSLRDATRAASKDHAGCEPRTARIVSAEKSTQHFTADVQALNVVSLFVEDAAVRVGLKPAEGKGDSAGHPIGIERTGFDRGSPIAFRRIHIRFTPVLDGGIEDLLPIDGAVEFADGLGEGFDVDINFSRQLFEGVGSFDRYPRHVVLFSAQHRAQVRIENLIGDGAGLLQDHLSVLGIGVVPEIRSLIQKTAALNVHDSAERIALSGKPVRQFPVAFVRCAESVPLQGYRPKRVDGILI